MLFDVLEICFQVIWWECKCRRYNKQFSYFFFMRLNYKCSIFSVVFTAAGSSSARCVSTSTLEEFLHFSRDLCILLALLGMFPFRSGVPLAAGLSQSIALLELEISFHGLQRNEETFLSTLKELALELWKHCVARLSHA